LHDEFLESLCPAGDDGSPNPQTSGRKAQASHRLNTATAARAAAKAEED